MTWRTQARCKGLGPSLFFGASDETHAERVKREAQAKALCAECEVKASCQNEGQGEEGIWGGLTDSERRKANQRSRYSPPKVYPVAVNLKPNQEPWTPLESCDDVMLFQRNSTESWHGCEFLVVRNGVLVYATFDLADAYLKYNDHLSK